MNDIWQNMLFDNIYRSPIAVNAQFTAASGGAATLRVTDETKGLAVLGGPGQAESVRPVCRVRASELAANNIALADLPDSSILINGQSWTVKATRKAPSPTGEDGGEIMLILLSES